MAPLDKDFYTVKELADILKVNPITIRRLEQRGELKSHQIGRSMRFRREDIESYLGKAKKSK